MESSEQDLVVAFAGDASDWDDEEDLPQPRQRSWPLLRRMRLPMVFAALVVIALIGFLWHSPAARHAAVVARPVPALPSATLASTAPAAPLRDTDGLVGERARVHFPTAGTDAEITTNRAVARLCPPPHTCMRAALLPLAVVRAVRDAFPSARIQYATTVAYISHTSGRQTLGYRVLRAVSSDREIDINVVPESAGDHAETGSVADTLGAVVFTQREVAGYSVQVVVHMTGAVLHPRALLRELPADRRLLELG